MPFGAFFIPIAEIKVLLGSQSSGYGSFCFSLKVVLDLVESAESPKIENPVAVRGVYESRKRHACVVPGRL